MPLFFQKQILKFQKRHFAGKAHPNTYIHTFTLSIYQLEL